MKSYILEYLACPKCRGDLWLDANHNLEEVTSGTLSCNQCGKAYPIKDGIPRFVSKSVSKREKETSQVFAYAWKLYGPRLSSKLNREFLERLPSWSQEDFRDKMILDVGCGAGRLSRLAADFGGKHIISVDISKAVDVAKSISKKYHNIHFIQANLFELPVKKIFDIVFSMGVLHHTPDPMYAYKSITKPLKENGKVGIWVYGKEGNEIMGPFLNLFRNLTTRFPNTLKAIIAKRIVSIIETINKKMPQLCINNIYAEYLKYFNEGLETVDRNYVAFDFLSTPIVHYCSIKDILTLVNEMGLKDVQYKWVNKNSYGVTAIK